MKAHSIHVEEKTIYKCACGAEFDDIKRAEAHLRRPPQEKPRSPRPKKQAPRRREPRPVVMAEPEVPSTGFEGA